MTNLYITSDEINRPDHGGGSVTFHESQALKSMGECEVWGQNELTEDVPEKWRYAEYGPWGYDLRALSYLEQGKVSPSLCHAYAGTFSETISHLKEKSCKVSYTSAAHRISDSRQAHEELGIPYNYEHLTDPEQWKKYSQGYMDADVLIVPSKHSEQVKREYGREGPIEVIPHGHNPPTDAKPMLDDGTFRVGYLGSFGPDKGVRYLLEAWGKINYSNAVLVLAGKDSVSGFAYELLHRYGRGAITCLGFVTNIGDFYNQINVYCQPSATEGFGLEVLESMSYARPVICSDHAGAVDLIRDHDCGYEFEAKNVDALCERIEAYRKDWHKSRNDGLKGKDSSAGYTWDVIRQRYVDVWKGLLG